MIVVPESPDGFYTSRSYVVVNAVPRKGYSFAWWRGWVWTGTHGFSGNPVEVPIVNERFDYTAHFTKQPLTSISTNAPGRRAVIDDREVRLPVNFPWTWGSRHRIGIPEAVQRGPSGTSRWVFKDWSDGGDATHTITVPDKPSTFTAYFEKQHLLTTVGAGRRGDVYVSPEFDDGFYGHGTPLQLTAVPAAGYEFSSWGGWNDEGRLGLFTRDNPTTLMMDEQGWIAADFTESRLLISDASPLEFSLPAVERPIFFSGDWGFRVNVPENAATLRVRLRTKTAGVDVDLHVNHGSDAILLDGRVVSDHSSEDPFGNESVYITRRTDPPLRAGTYFISFTLWTTGKRVEATISATVD